MLPTTIQFWLSVDRPEQPKAAEHQSAARTEGRQARRGGLLRRNP